MVDGLNDVFLYQKIWILNPNSQLVYLQTVGGNEVLLNKQLPEQLGW
jgi:hypothetical protein